MGVTIKIERPLGRDYFTSAETISGTVEFNLRRSSAASRVVAFLEGCHHLSTHLGNMANCARRQAEDCGCGLDRIKNLGSVNANAS